MVEKNVLGFEMNPFPKNSVEWLLFENPFPKNSVKWLLFENMISAEQKSHHYAAEAQRFYEQAATARALAYDYRETLIKLGEKL